MLDLLLDKYIYFDVSGNKPVTKDCISYALNFINVGNPSITCNKFGNSVGNLITEVNKLIRSYLHCNDKNIEQDYDITFTSGSSESIATVFNMFAQSYSVESPCKVLTFAGEHHTTIQCCESWVKKKLLKVDYVSSGTSLPPKLEEIEEFLKVGNYALLSVCHINNELGTVIDIEKLASICHKYGTLIHVDATQSFSKYKMPDVPCVDFFSVSGHKFGTPVGIGLLIVNKKVLKKMKYVPLIFGTQNNGMRGGTQSGFLIASMFYELFNNIPRIDTYFRIITKFRYIFFKRMFEIFPNAISFYDSKNKEQMDKFINIGENKSINSTSGYLNYLKSGGKNDKYSIMILIPRPITDEVEYANFMIVFSILLIKDNKIIALPKRDTQEYLAKNHVLVGIGSACSVTSSSHVYKIFADEIQKSIIRVTFCEENRMEDIDFCLKKIEKLIKLRI